jgi:hypothetical protein
VEHCQGIGLIFSIDLPRLDSLPISEGNVPLMKVSIRLNVRSDDRFPRSVDKNPLLTYSMRIVSA